MLALQFEVYGLTFPAAETEAGLMAKMSACLNAFRAVTTHNNYVYVSLKTDSDFKKNYPEMNAILNIIKNIREQINGNEKG